jgi:hypothetical protein
MSICRESLDGADSKGPPYHAHTNVASKNEHPVESPYGKFNTVIGNHLSIHLVLLLPTTVLLLPDYRALGQGSDCSLVIGKDGISILENAKRAPVIKNFLLLS